MANTKIGEIPKDLRDLKQPFNAYMKYSVILDLKKISKKTERTLSDIIESALIEYFTNHNLLTTEPERGADDTAV